MAKRPRIFFHDGETLAVNKIADGTEFDGMFEVTDTSGFRISVAITSNLAVQGAIDEIEYIQYHVNAFLIQMFGECA